MRSQTPSRVPSLPTRLSTQLSSQLARGRALPPSSTASLPRLPRLLFRNASNTPLTTSRSSTDEFYAMAGPVRTSHERVEAFNPLDQPSAQSSSSTPAKKSPVHAPRPPNPWILYRRDKLQSLLSEHPQHKRLPQAELSKMISTLWKQETPAVRQHYEIQADIAKEQHQKEFPEYQFRPMKKADKERLREEKRLEKEREREAKQRAKQLQTQMRNGQVPQQQQPQAQTPAPSTLQPPAPAGMPMAPAPMHVARIPQPTSNSNQVQHLILMRCGVTGPSPPISECPSLDGSPLMPVIDQVDSSSSRSSSLSLSREGRVSASPTPTPGLFDASSSSLSIVAPQPSVPLRPPSASALHLPSSLMQDASRPPSTVQSQSAISPWAQLKPSAEQSDLLNPGQSDHQGEALMDWMDPSFLQNVQEGMFDFNALSDASLNLPPANEGELSLGFEDSATRAAMHFTNVPNVFGLDFPSASFDDPLGEIYVQAANPFVGSTDGTEASATGNDFDQLISQMGIDSFLANMLSGEQGSGSDAQMTSTEISHLAQYAARLVEVNNKVRQEKMEAAVADYSMNVQAGLGTVEGVGFVAPATLSVGPLPSPPESSSAGSQAAQSPATVVQPTNVGASCSGSGGQRQVAQTQAPAQMYAQQHMQSQSQKLGEASHPTPPASAGPLAPSPQAIHDDAHPRPVPTHSHSAPGYVPPSGAANATRRRAAGSWRPPTS